MKPPLVRIHDDATLNEPANRASLRYARKQSAADILESLPPNRRNFLKVKPDGRVFDGNIRIKVLEERRYPVDGLPRETI